MTDLAATVCIICAAVALWLSLWLWFCTDTRMNRLEENQHQHDKPVVEPVAPVSELVPAPRTPGRHRPGVPQ